MYIYFYTHTLSFARPSISILDICNLCSAKCHFICDIYQFGVLLPFIHSFSFSYFFHTHHISLFPALYYVSLFGRFSSWNVCFNRFDSFHLFDAISLELYMPTDYMEIIHTSPFSLSLSNSPPPMYGNRTLPSCIEIVWYLVLPLNVEPLRVPHRLKLFLDW